MSDKQSRIHLARLVRILDDSTSSPPQDEFQLIKLQTTARHARHLLHDISHRPPRDSFLDLELRLEKAEKALQEVKAKSQLINTARSNPFILPSSSSSSSSLFFSAPEEDEDDEDLTLPPPPTLTFPTQSASSAASSSSRPSSPSLPAVSELRDASAFASSASSAHGTTSERTSTRGEDKDNALPQRSVVDAPFPDSNEAPNELRKRPTPIPPYLAARRAREAEKAAQQNKGKGKEKERDAVDDLLPADSSSSSGDLLSHHHSLQSSLLSDLTTLSSALKGNTLAFSENLAKDKEVMEKAQGKLEVNEGSMKKEQGRLKEVRGKSRGTTCWTVGAVLVVVFMWIVMFGLMRVT
ncbi:hypothetical protein JCM11641_003276 [Rhodosporidiobolus odoratus]